MYVLLFIAWLFVGCDVCAVDVVHMPGCDVCTVDVHMPGCLLVVMYVLLML